MIVRKIVEQDVESVSGFIARNFDEIMSRYHSKHIIEKFKSHNTPEKVRTQMQWKEIFVVEEDNEIIAMGALVNFRDMENPKYSVSNFFVKPELHNRGIGKLLFLRILDTAKGKGAELLHVPSSRNAVAFYEKMGFVQDEIQNDMEDEITWMRMKVK